MQQLRLYSSASVRTSPSTRSLAAGSRPQPLLPLPLLPPRLVRLLRSRFSLNRKIALTSSHRLRICFPYPRRLHRRFDRHRTSRHQARDQGTSDVLNADQRSIRGANCFASVSGGGSSLSPPPLIMANGHRLRKDQQSRRVRRTYLGTVRTSASLYPSVRARLATSKTERPARRVKSKVS